MGIFSFLSSNYKAKDFLDKTPKQIIDDMKMDKLSEEIKKDEEYNSLPEETKGAIDMLLDLKKGKIEIFDKCYKRGSRAAAASNRPMPRPASVRPASVRPGSLMRPASVRMANNGKPGPIVHAGPFKNPEGQAGGRRKKRTGRKRKTRRSRKTRKR
jgi:hypothetical protein